MFARIRLLSIAIATLISSLFVTVGDTATVQAACQRGARLNAAQLNASFANPGLGSRPGAEGFGGGDYQHSYALPDGRVLWLFQDMYFSNDNDLANPVNNAAHNAGLIQDGECFSVLGSQGRDLIGDAQTIDSRRWFWPLDGEIGFDGNLWIFMVEMSNPQGTGAGLGALPVRTWLAILDPVTLQQLYFEPTADTSNRLNGWSVVSAGGYSYLYGHCYRQYANNANSAAQFDGSCMPYTYLARVPVGHFEMMPEYWSAGGWTTNGAAAAPVMARGAANPMSVQWFGDTFVSVTKADDWWGTVIHVDRAQAPQGPWVPAQADISVVNDRKCSVNCGNYGAQLMPWLDAAGKLTIALSNGGDFALWLANGRLYRPTFYSIDVPQLGNNTSAATPPAFSYSTVGNAGFLAVDPRRLVDTREAGAQFGRLTAGSVAVLDLRPFGIPNGTTAVALNVTTANAQIDGWVRAFPCTSAEPETSNVNPAAGQVATNGAFVAIGDGRICFRTAQDVDLIVDLNGWLTTAANVGLQPVASRRLVDTRIGLGATILTPGATLEVPVVGPGSSTTAVVLNLTAVSPVSGGFVTAWPCGVERPVVSNLNPEPGITRPNLVNVRVGAGGKVCLYSTARTDLLVDLFGEFVPGNRNRYAPVPPQRLFDSRRDDRLRHQSNLAFVVPMNGPSFVAAHTNVTAVFGVSAGFLTGYPCLSNQWPGTSNVNFVAGLASANSALLTSSRGYACVFSSAQTDVVVDLFGVWSAESGS